MSGLFSEREFIRIAVQMERNGEQFYNTMSEKAEDEGISIISDELAEAERQHVKDFEGIGTELPEDDAAEQYEGELEDYASALLRTRVFAGDNAGQRMAAEAGTVTDAVTAAIASEREPARVSSDLSGTGHARSMGWGNCPRVPATREGC